MDKHYWNDFRQPPEPLDFACCDCRNTIRIHTLERYPHGTDHINFCPVCGAKTIGVNPSFKEVTCEL